MNVMRQRFRQIRIVHGQQRVLLQIRRKQRKEHAENRDRGCHVQQSDFQSVGAELRSDMPEVVDDACAQHPDGNDAQPAEIGIEMLVFPIAPVIVGLVYFSAPSRYTWNWTLPLAATSSSTPISAENCVYDPPERL